MYEQFSDRARKVMQLANQRAQHFNQEYIQPEHILLGIIKEGTGGGRNVLLKLGVDLERLDSEIVETIKDGPEMITMGKLPLASGATSVIEYALKSSLDMQHRFIGTEHLLLGLLQCKDSVPQTALNKNGVTIENARQQVGQILRQRDADQDTPKTRVKSRTGKRLTPQAKRAKAKKDRRLAQRKKTKNDGDNTPMDQLIEQIHSLSQTERMNALISLWSEVEFQEQTPRLTTEVLKCERDNELIHVEVVLTNVSLCALVISGFEYHFPSLTGKGSCYCLCEPGKSNKLTFVMVSEAENEASVSLIGFNPQTGFPMNGGDVIHGFVVSAGG